MALLRGARILLGVTGGIAAYKSVDLASKLVQSGAIVDTILTEAGGQFVGAAGLQAITKRPVHESVFEPWTESWFGHVSLGQEADVLVVAPATADAIAKLAHGFASDMLGAAALAASCPLIIAPAMEHSMFHHSATQQNLKLLKDRGAFIVGPESGRLASGEFGDGRMSDPQALLGAIRYVLGRTGFLAGKRIVVTAGGTLEAIDPVRFIGNRSSGLMGYAIAQSAIDAGACVTLITGPTALLAPYGATTINVRAAVDMQKAVDGAVIGADSIVMAAAVSDFRPANKLSDKIKKSQVGPHLTLDLVANPDIIAGVEQPGLLKIGFAAETSSLVEHALTKLQEKHLDLVVANDAEIAIGNPNNAVTLVWPDGTVEPIPLMPKTELADILVERIGGLLNGS